MPSSGPDLPSDSAQPHSAKPHSADPQNDAPADPPSPKSLPPPEGAADADEFNEFPAFLENDADDTPADSSNPPNTFSNPPASSTSGAPSAEPPNTRGEMGFLDHLEEFRVTAIKSVAALFVGMILVGLFFNWFFQVLLYPLHRAIRLANVPNAPNLLYTTTPMGVFSVLFEVTLFGGIALALPFIGYFVIGFVAPGLTDREKNLLRPALLSALGLFAVGAMFSFFFLAPAAFAVSIKLNHALELTQMWNAADYYQLVTWLTLGTGLVFEFPLVLVILQVLDVVSTAQLRLYRRHAVVVILCIAALIAPPEVVAMTLMAVPMYVLFEISLIVGERLRRRHVAAKAVEETLDTGG